MNEWVSCDSLRYDGRDFDLDASLLINQAHDLHRRHRRIVLAEILAVRGADLLARTEWYSCLSITYQRHADDVLRAGAALGQDGHGCCGVSAAPGR